MNEFAAAYFLIIFCWFIKRQFELTLEEVL